MRGYARFVKSTATILSWRATPASHISSSKIVWESSRGETPVPLAVAGRGRREDSRINTSQKSVFWCNDLPRDSQPRKITSRKLFITASSFSRTINNSRNDYIVTHKISLRYRQALNRGARRLRDRETRYSKRRRSIFFWIFSLTLRPLLRAWRCGNK